MTIYPPAFRIQLCALFLAQLCFKVHIPVASGSESCSLNFRTQSQGGWLGAGKRRGENNVKYLLENFDRAFDTGILTIGVDQGETNRYVDISLTDLLEIKPGGKPDILPPDCIDGSCALTKNNLVTQTIALTLNTEFDACSRLGKCSLFCDDCEYGPPLLLSPVIAGTCKGMTVEEVLHEANLILGGLESNYSITEVLTCVDDINLNYKDGDSNGGKLGCPTFYPTSAPTSQSISPTASPTGSECCNSDGHFILNTQFTCSAEFFMQQESFFLYDYSDFWESDVFDCLKELKGLKRLVIHARGSMTELPPGLFDGLPQLTYLRFSVSNVQAINISSLVNENHVALEYLYLGLGYCNEITSTLEPLGKVSPLRVLDLYMSRVTILPADFFLGLSSVQNLYINTAVPGTFPSTLKDMTALQSFRFWNRETEKLNDDMFQFMPYLTFVDIYGGKLASVPKSLTERVNITRFSLTAPIADMRPDHGSLAKLVNLETLSLSVRYINDTHFDDDMLTQMEKLKSFSIWSDRLTYVPASVLTRTSLTYLSLRAYRMAITDDIVSQLQELTSLYLAVNFSNIKSFPSSAANLPKLSTLSYSISGTSTINIPRNYLDNLNSTLERLTLTFYEDFDPDIPDELFEYLQNLKYFSLYGKGITKVPTSIANITSAYTDIRAIKATSFADGIFKNLQKYYWPYGRCRVTIEADDVATSSECEADFRFRTGLKDECSLVVYSAPFLPECPSV